MEETLAHKPSMAERMMAFVYGLFRNHLNNHANRQIEPKGFSKFEAFTAMLPQDHPQFEQVVNVASLCDEALRMARNRLALAGRIKETEEKLAELSCFALLADEDATNMKNLLDRFVSLTKERNTLIYQLTSFDKNLSHMMRLEDDAVGSVVQMQDAEKSQRILRQDIAHLEGEKAELVHEKGFLEASMVFIRRFGVALVFLFGCVAVFLGYLVMTKGQSIFIPTTVLVLLAIVVVTLLHLFYKRMKYELRVNIKKQQRAVEILNKKNVVFAYYTNFLKFECTKYKVRNAHMLKANLTDYKNYKHITMRIDAIRQIMYETESQITIFLREKNIAFAKFTIEQFAQTVDVADKIDFTRELAQEKSVLENNLLALDAKHGALWDLIETMQEKDQTEEHIVTQMIQSYFEQVSGLFGHNPKEEMLEA